MSRRPMDAGLRCALSWALLALCASCVLTPTDEQNLCGSDAVVSFAGYTLAAGQVVELQSSATATGTFTTFATATSASSSITVGGTQLFAWSVTSMVPRWVLLRTGREVYVRGQLAGGGGLLVSFDTVNPSGQTQFQCLSSQIGAGKTAIEAANHCKSADAPVIRLRAPRSSSCCEPNQLGDVVIDSAQAASRHQCMTTLDGDLTITDTAPSNVQLASLTSVHGDVTIDYTTTSGTARVVNLSSLPNIDGQLALRASVVNGPLELGLDEVDWVNGDVHVTLENTGALVADVNGLSDLTAIPSQFSVHLTSRGAFESTDFMPQFTSTETVFIESLGVDTSLGIPLTLPSLRLAIDLFVSYPAGLVPAPNHYGWAPRQLLPKLETVGFFKLTNDPYYPGYSQPLGTTPRNYPKLQSVGLLWIEGSQLSGLDLGVDALSLSALTLRANPAFTSLTRPGLTFASSSGPITIVDNPALRECEALAFTLGHTGTNTVSGNHPAPCVCSSPSSVTGDVHIDEPADATSHGCTGSISGNLTVLNHPRLTRVGLPVLTSVGGSVELDYSVGDYRRNGDKRVIDLPALSSVGGDLSMSATFGDLATPGLNVGMNALGHVGGSIDFTASFGGLSGLGGLITHGGDVYVHGPNLDVQGTGLMPNLTRVDGNVRVEGYFQFLSFFPGITSIGGNLEVIDVRMLGGFARLTSVAGDLVLHPKFMSPLAQLTSVGGSLTLRNSNLASIDVSSVPMTAAHLLFAGNPNLTTLDAGVRIPGAGVITIQNNPSLPTCAANAYVSAQVAAGFTGTSLVVGNGVGSCP